MRARLVGISGPAAGMTFEIDGRAAIGRSSESHVQLADRSVSREHCRIEAGSNGFVIRDLESHTGTRVNDNRVTECTLEDGDRVSIGGSRFVFMTGDAAVPSVDPPVEFEDDAVTTEVRVNTADAVYASPHARLNWRDRGERHGTWRCC